MNEFWNNVDAILRIKDIRKKELAAGINKSPSHLSEMISGKAETSLTTMSKVAAFLSITLSDLVRDNFLDFYNKANEKSEELELTQVKKEICEIIKNLPDEEVKLWLKVIKLGFKKEE